MEPKIEDTYKAILEDFNSTEMEAQQAMNAAKARLFDAIESLMECAKALVQDVEQKNKEDIDATCHTHRLTEFEMNDLYHKDKKLTDLKAKLHVAIDINATSQ